MMLQCLSNYLFSPWGTGAISDVWSVTASTSAKRENLYCRIFTQEFAKKKENFLFVAPVSSIDERLAFVVFAHLLFYNVNRFQKRARILSQSKRA